MLSHLSTLDAEQFAEIKHEEMTLLHHIAFDGDHEALASMESLPYFKDLIDVDSNDVKP